VSLLDKALVLFSGGQDSTVCLVWALQRFTRVGNKMVIRERGKR
jgi:7-cyano-7-deazaguanine synthase in queuosine biosynthesis